MSENTAPALIIIDVQKAIDSFSDYERNNLDAELNISKLLNVWRDRGFPVYHIRHSSKFEESPYHESNLFDFKDIVTPVDGEAIMTKSENCAFIGTNLESHLKAENISDLVICGVLTNNSIDVTVRVAKALGFAVNVVSDATASFGIQGLNGKYYPSDDVHWLFLSNLNDEYCKVLTTGELLSLS